MGHPAPHPFTSLRNRPRDFLRAALGLLAGFSLEAAQVSSVTVSPTRSLRDAPVLVTLATETSGATIRYTTDGRPPTATTGFVYQGPVLVTGTTVVRAAGFKTGSDPSDVATHTYLFLDQVLRQNGVGLPNTWGDSRGVDYAMDPLVTDSVTYRDRIKAAFLARPSLCLTLDPDDLFSNEVRQVDGLGKAIEYRGIYLEGKGFQRAASVELLRSDGGKDFAEGCSLEIQGASSADRWNTYKLSMRLRFDSAYGASRLEQPLFGPGGTDQIKNVILDATNQMSWLHADPASRQRAQYLRDQLVGDYQNATGTAAPHGQHYHLFLNGLYWGLYWAHEYADKNFAAAYRGGAGADYDVMRHRADNPTDGDNIAYLDLFTQANRVPADASAYADVVSRLDVPSFCDYMVINYFAGNSDWAFQNWVASRKRVAGALWQYHNWDGERTFIGPNDNVVPETNSDKVRAEADADGSPTYLLHRLKSHPDFRMLLADRAERLLRGNGILTPARSAQFYQDRLATVDPAVIAESARWGDQRRPGQPYTRDTEFVAERDRLLGTWFPVRANNLITQLRAENLYPAMDPPTVSPAAGTAVFPLQVSFTTPAGCELWLGLNGLDPRAPGGTVAGGAILQTAATRSVTASTRLLARARNTSTGEWSALAEAVYHAAGFASAARVSEINFNPAAPTLAEDPTNLWSGSDMEFVELLNTSASASLDLSGGVLGGGISCVLPAGSMLPANGRAVVVRNLAAFRVRYGNTPTVLGTFTGGLANSGDTISLTGPLGQPILSFSYADTWQPLADGGGPTLTLVEPPPAASQLGQAASWRRSLRSGGSPGAPDTAPPPAAITEINFHPADPLPDEDAKGYTSDSFEFIELQNPGTSSLPLAGARLVLDGTTTLHTFPAGTSLAPGARWVVAANSAAFAFRHPETVANSTGFAAPLPNSSAEITLVGSGGELLFRAAYDDRWQPSADGLGATLTASALFSASSGSAADTTSWTASLHFDGSPGAAEPAAPPNVRVTELMYNGQLPNGTASDLADWIELTNTGTSSVSLAGWTLADRSGLNRSPVILCTISAGVSLAAGESAVLMRDATTFAGNYQGVPRVIGTLADRFKNSSGTLLLRTSGGAVVQEFTYSDAWFSSTDGAGYSLVAADTTQPLPWWSLKQGWRRGSVLQGTPGRMDTAYHTWRMDRFNSATQDDDLVSGPAADPDHDGLSNFAEFSLGLSPQAADTSVLKPATFFVEIGRERYLAFSHGRSRSAPGTVWTVETSPDGKTWTADAAEVVTVSVQPLDSGADLVMVRSARPVTVEPRRFFRLRISGW